MRPTCMAGSAHEQRKRLHVDARAAISRLEIKHHRWAPDVFDYRAPAVTRVAVVSIRKLAQHLGISRSRANQELQRAKRKGEP